MERRPLPLLFLQFQFKDEPGSLLVYPWQMN
jgi:hypothetical protein